MLIRAMAAGAALVAAGASAQPVSVTLNATAEATILDDPSLAIGFGKVFVGTTNQGSTRRGLVRFDLSSLPDGEVVSATLNTLVINQRGFGLNFDAHRLLSDWNEGPAVGGGSNGGQGGQASSADATWTQTGLGTPWAAGGSFVATSTASASSQFAGTSIGFDVTDDVRAMRNKSLPDFGWILISQTEPTSGNVIGISTDDEGFPAITLTVEIEEQCLADTNGDGIVSPADFNGWIQAFNAQSAACDQNGDGLCSPQDFNAWIQNYNAGC